MLMETVSAVEGIREFDGGTAPNSVPSFAHAVAENKIGQKSEETAVGISGHAAFPDGTQNAIGILCGKLKMQNFPEQTKMSIRICGESFRRRLWGKNQKFVVLMNVLVD